MVEAVERFKRELTLLLGETEKCLRDAKTKADANATLEECLKPWATTVVKFCEEQKKSAEIVLSTEPTPAKEEAETSEDFKPPVIDLPKKEAEPPKVKAEPEVEDAPPPLPKTLKPRKPKAKGRKLPSKNLLAARAKEEDEDADAITLDKSDLPPEMTVTEEEEEAAGGRVRGSVAVPIFNAGVMGELNKALGARMQRKSSLKEEEKKEDEPAKAEAKPDLTIEQPKVPLVPLKPVKLVSPAARESQEKKAEAAPEIPPWKLELQKRKKSAIAPPKPKPAAVPPPSGGAQNELAAILQRRKEKSGG